MFLCSAFANHGGTVTSCSLYAHPGYAEICILHRIWSTVALGTYELAFLINIKKTLMPSKLVKPDVREWCPPHMVCMFSLDMGSGSAQGNFLGYFQSLPLWVGQPILILSPFVEDPQQCRGDIALRPSFGPPTRQG